jgi:nucleotide-binding universal stress UspA family protein
MTTVPADRHTAGPAHGADGNTRRIIVGIDGSQGSQFALQWAMREAALHNAVLEAVLCWPVDVWTGMVELFFPVELGADPEAILKDAVEDVAQRTGFDAARIATRVVPEHPIAGLLRTVGNADVLVVGSSGHGVIAGALLGSISRAVVLHAPCTVIVVPTETQRRQRAAHLSDRSGSTAVPPSEGEVWPAIRGTAG